MTSRKFRKKPLVVEAVQWTGDNHGEIAAFLFGADWTIIGCEEVMIHTPEGVMAAGIGDWIIKGVKGEFYPCKPDIFRGHL